MVKTLTEHGNSLAIVIDKPILELLNITKDTPLRISTDGQSLWITPETKASHKAKLRSALSKVNQRHGETLRKLAE